MKINQEAGFIYEGSPRIVINSGNQYDSISGLQDSSEEVLSYTNGKETPDSLEWSDIYNIPSSNNITNFILSEADISAGGSRSQSRSRQQLIQKDQFVYIQSDDGTEKRHNSSTRCDFLEPFLSVSSSLNTDTSDLHSVMSDIEKLCSCTSGKLANECCGAGAEGGGAAEGGLDTTMKAMLDAVEKIDGLVDAVEQLQIQVIKQNSH